VISLVHGTLSVLFEAFCVKSYQGPLLEKPCRRHKEDHASHDTRVQMNYKKKNRHCFCFISQCTNRTMSEDGPLLSLILQVYQTHPDLSNGSMFSNRGSSFSPASCFMCSWRLSSWTSWWSLTNSWSSCTKQRKRTRSAFCKSSLLDINFKSTWTDFSLRASYFYFFVP